VSDQVVPASTLLKGNPMKSQTAWTLLPVWLLVLATSGFSDEPAESPEAAAALRKLGADVSADSVSIRSAEVTDADLIHLKGMTSVTKVALMGCKKVTDAGLVHLEGLKNVETLYLPYTSVGDAGLAHLKGMTGLTNLYLSGTKVGDEGLAHLKGTASLRVLYLDCPGVSDAGLEHLAGLRLVTLSLNDTKVTNAGLKHLTGMKNLYELRLSRTKVTDAGLADLKEVAEIRDLFLQQTEVTDAGLENLKVLTKLKHLDLTKTKVTEAGVKKLQQALPNCSIEHSAADVNTVVAGQMGEKQVSFADGLGTYYEGLLVAVLGTCSVEADEKTATEGFKKAMEEGHLRVKFVKPRTFLVDVEQKEVEAEEILVPISAATMPDRIYVRNGKTYRAFAKHEPQICFFIQGRLKAMMER
jgi:hypothetical protein